MIPEFVERLLPYRPDDFEGFVSILSYEECDFVKAKGKRKGSRSTACAIDSESSVEAVANHYGWLHYYLVLESETKSGKSVVFKERVWTRFENSYVSGGDHLDRDALRLFSTAIYNLDRIEKKLPSIKTNIVTSEGIFEESMYERLPEDKGLDFV